jgi:hypothetical protein
MDRSQRFGVRPAPPLAAIIEEDDTMAPIRERDTIVKKFIRIALGDKGLEDEEMLERAQICATAAMSIIAAVKDNECSSGPSLRFSSRICTSARTS